MTLRNIMMKTREYLNLRPYKGDEREIVEQINAGITFRGGTLWVLIFAIFIASLGLNVNSTAVIIGAMLISPLMGPIIGMGFAIGTVDMDMLKRSAVNFAVATIFSILTATIYWLLTPLNEAQSELLARTSPTLYDVLIAFCGGAAGIIALCTKGKGNVIPGVAIATALMPPLCTAGFGLGTGQIRFFLGAIYLFFINTVFIATATSVGVKFMHFKSKGHLSNEMSKKVRRRITAVMVVFLIPALFITIGIVQKSIFEHNLKNFVKNEISQSGTQIISSEATDNELRIVAVGNIISEMSQHRATEHLAQYGLEKYRLNIIQGLPMDSVLSLSSTALNQQATNQQLLDLSTKNHLMEEQLSHYKNLESLGAEIEGEVHVLFPEVKHLTFASAVTNTDKSQYVIALATMNEQSVGSARNEEWHQLHDWLQTRVKSDSLLLIELP